jgi:integrase
MKLTDKVARSLAPPTDRHERITYDGGFRDAIAGFGIRVTRASEKHPAGSRSFVFNYKVRGTGVERRMTLGSFPSWSADQAREEAKRLRRLVEQDRDPMAERQAAREAPTMDEAFDRYGAEHAPTKRTGEADKAAIEKWLRPALGRMKVDDVTHDDVKAVHADITAKGSPITANRTVALLSKVFSLALTWQVVTEAGKQPWRSPAKGNPARGIRRNVENRRTRYLEGDEMVRLLRVLAGRKDLSALAVRLALLTGARRGEILGATWEQFDLKRGRWWKPASSTKQQRDHILPLSAPARQLLAEMRAEAERRAAKVGLKVKDADFVFPSRGGADTPQRQLKRAWKTICEAAGLEDFHYHDLRHSHASLLVSGGSSLPLIGSLLGHSNPQTTQRYAHLLDDPQRKAVERLGAEVEAAEGKRPSAEVVDHPATVRK